MGKLFTTLQTKIQTVLQTTLKKTEKGKKDMALYQPSNITPSTFAGIGGGVVDTSDNISISWQVNGNSAMTSFSIQIQTNGATPATVATLTPASPITPFNGTDAKGNPVFYVYEPGVTWASKGLSNGNEYRLVITQYWSEGGTTKSVTQNSPSVFITRAKPTLSISPSSSTLTSVTQTFTGTFAQAQNDSIAWVRWILTDSNGVLEDTGVVYTSVLSFEYNGFFNGETYYITLYVETENGVQVMATGEYDVEYSVPSATGSLKVECQPDDSAKVQWAKALDIPGTESGTGSITYTDVGVNLATKSVSWSTVNDEPMSFPAPWQLFWKGKVGNISETSFPTTPSADDWEKVKEYDALDSTTLQASVSDNWKNWNKDTSKDPTLQETTSITPSQDSRVELDAQDSLLMYSYSKYPTSIAGTVKATFFGWAEYPLRAVNPVTFIRFDNLVTTYESPTPSIVVQREYNNSRKCYMDKIYVTGVGVIMDYSRPCSVYITNHYEYYTADVFEQPSGSNPRDFELLETNAYSVTLEDVLDGRVRIKLLANTTSAYTVKYSYKADYVGNDAYYAEVDVDYANIESASIASTTAPGGASVRVREGKTCKVIFYAPSPGNYTANIDVQYWIKVDGAESYRCIVRTMVLFGTPIASLSYGVGDFNKIEVKAEGSYLYYYLYNNAPTSDKVLTYHNFAVIHSTTTQPTAYSVFAEDGNGNGIKARILGNYIVINETDQVEMPKFAFYAYVSFKPTTIKVVFYDYDNNYISEETISTSTAQFSIAKVGIASSVHCFVGVSENTTQDMTDPMWDAEMCMLALFKNTLQAGTITSSATYKQTALYRKEGSKLFPLGVFPFNSDGLKDYALRSNRECTYILYYILDGVYSVGVESDVVCKRFKQYTLTEAELQDDGTYLALKTWRFANNIEASAVGNNNSPATLNNFTQYPMWQPSNPSPRSGTLSALLGRFVNGQYSGETTDDMDELYAISHSTNTFFLKDMKGNLIMVKPNGAISQSTNNKSGMLEVTVSVPWIEVGDASKATILKF